MGEEEVLGNSSPPPLPIRARPEIGDFGGGAKLAHIQQIFFFFLQNEPVNKDEDAFESLLGSKGSLIKISDSTCCCNSASAALPPAPFPPVVMGGAMP